MHKIPFGLVVTILVLSPIASAEQPATEGRIKMDVEVTDLAGVNAKTELVELANIKASEIEPFVRNRLSRYGAVQVNDFLNMLIITDLQPKLGDLVRLVTHLDRRGVEGFLRLETEAIPLSYVSPSKLVPILQERLSPDGTIQADEDLNLVIVTDVRSKIENLKGVLPQLDVPPKQVAIEAGVLEIDAEYSRELGIDWFSLPEALSRGEIYGSLYSDRRDGETVVYGRGELRGLVDFQTLVDLIKQSVEQGKARLSSMPKVVVQNNRTGEIWLGGEIITYARYYGERDIVPVRRGLNLSITPHIGAGNLMTLEVLIEQTDLERWHVPDYPVVTGGRINTTVMLRDGETYILGSARKKVTTSSEKGIPVLRSIPLLGYLFKREERRTYDKDIVIVITPHLLEIGEGLGEKEIEKWHKMEKEME